MLHSNGSEETKQAGVGAGEGYVRREVVKGVLKNGDNRDEGKWVEGARCRWDQELEVGRGILRLGSGFSMGSLKIHGLGIRPTQTQVLVLLCDSGQKT